MIKYDCCAILHFLKESELMIMDAKILIINGPNMNMLGTREVNVYGEKNLEEINSSIVKYFVNENVNIDFYQSNLEGEIINKLQDCRNVYDGVVINPGAYCHYSIAILDAIRAIHTPVVEVHISNIYSREEYRKHSVTAEGCIGIISGFGYFSYILGVQALLNIKCDRD